MNSKQIAWTDLRDSLTSEDLKQFREKGYIGPFSLFNETEINSLIKKCTLYPELIFPRMRGIHSVVKEIAELALHPSIINKIVPLMGTDILLWGSQLIKQKPLDKHRWHIDVEHMAWEGVTVWLALTNVITQESFSVITGSHLFNTTPQGLHAKHGLNLTSDAAVANAAKMISKDSELVHVKVENGQFIIFEGKLWHGTKNTSPNMRKAIILQYTTPSYKVKIPKNNDYPNTRWYAGSPDCLLVHGRDNFGYNKLISIKAISAFKSFVKGIFVNFPINILQKSSRTIKLVLKKN